MARNTDFVPKIDPETQPLFIQMKEKGIAFVDQAHLEGQLTRLGWTLVCFTEDPNRIKETMDMAVIFPEIKDAFEHLIDRALMTNFKEARAMASSFGIQRLPAIGLFKKGHFMGAVESLRPWNEYLEELTAISQRQTEPEHRISLVAQIKDPS